MYNSILTGLVLALSFSLDLGAQEITFVNSEVHLSKAYPFSEATIVNGIIYLSGEIGTLANGSVIPGGIVPETQQTLRNIDATLKRMSAFLENFFKCTCMLADIADWPEMSKAYKLFFKPGNFLLEVHLRGVD